jgi:Alpha-glutamyl/putrescinyl thymine pyrophosphorylase clade 2
VEIPPGADLRLPEYRREAFLRFYAFHLKYRTHPGCVYFALPHLATALNWDTNQRYWAAWLNANTQNPATTLLLMHAGATPEAWRETGVYQQANWATLQWDTDRKYQKTTFPEACEKYADLMKTAGGQAAYWAGTQDWNDAWKRMTALPYMGRLSAWSGLEYFRLLTDAPIPDADTFMLEDTAGSRSHRNGIALVMNQDHVVIDGQLNPGNTKPWPPAMLTYLDGAAEGLLTEAHTRGYTGASRLTMESALCTWKSWWKKNRRYPNVYADMMHDRIRWAEARHGDRFGVLWDARRDALPTHLRLEDTPTDPGLSAVKQNWYRETGQQVLLGYDWPELWSGFDTMVKEGKFGTCR